MIKILGVLLTIIFFSGCVTNSRNKLSDFQQGFEKSRDQLGDDVQFAFIAFDNHYYFAPARYFNNDKNCALFFGYKNDQLTYQFTRQQMYELQRIFEAKLNVDKKSKEILAKIESFPKGNFKCPNHEVELPKSEKVINFVFYGPIVAIATPFILPLYFKEVSQQSDLRKVRLGMSETEIDQIFKGGSDLWLSHKLHHDSFILKRMTRAYTDHSLSFVYENKKLVGYVWSSWHNTGDPKYLVP